MNESRICLGPILPESTALGSVRNASGAALRHCARFLASLWLEIAQWG
jgi:hypothetical protein